MANSANKSLQIRKLDEALNRFFVRFRDFLSRIFCTGNLKVMIRLKMSEDADFEIFGPSRRLVNSWSYKEKLNQSLVTVI